MCVGPRRQQQNGRPRSECGAMAYMYASARAAPSLRREYHSPCSAVIAILRASRSAANFCGRLRPISCGRACYATRGFYADRARRSQPQRCERALPGRRGSGNVPQWPEFLGHRLRLIDLDRPLITLRSLDGASPGAAVSHGHLRLLPMLLHLSRIVALRN
jgi:hypothetical protein